MTEGITLITPTGGRDRQLALCRKYIERQTYAGPLQWIVVDDVGCAPVGFSRGLLTKIFPEPRWQSGQNTLARNLAAAIPEVRYDLIFIIEDDDWYGPEYLAAQVQNMNGAPLVGEVPARYYHFSSGQFWELSNANHASLCQTGMRREALTALGHICSIPNEVFIDVRLWDRSFGKLHQSSGCVGIKGLPGRAGIGVGHRPSRVGAWTRDSQDRKVLRDWIGDDAALYEAF